jgi:hypothetical protein
MVFQEISSTDHSLLLYRIDFLPFDEAHEIKAVFFENIWRVYGSAVSFKEALPGL